MINKKIKQSEVWNTLLKIPREGENAFCMMMSFFFTKSHSNINGNYNLYSNHKLFLLQLLLNLEEHPNSRKIFQSGSLCRPMRFPSHSSSHVEITQLISLSVAPRLLPFIKKYHSDENYIFWPNQAGCPYAEHSLDFFLPEFDPSCQ